MTMRPTTAGAARWIERNPRALPALQRAHGIQQRMYGHALPASGPRACAHEALVPGREHSSGRASTLEPRPDHTRGARGTAPEHVGVGGRARGFRRRSRHPRCLLFRRTRPSTGAHASLRRLSPSMESKSKPEDDARHSSWGLFVANKKREKTLHRQKLQLRRKRVKGLELLPGMVNMVVTADELMAYEAFHIKDALKKHEWRW